MDIPYLSDDARKARQRAHRHIDNCSVCVSTDWCEIGSSLWHKYSVLRERDRKRFRVTPWYD